MAKETVQSVERTFKIMELMAARGKMGVREIAVETGLHSTVVHRILSTLVETGYAGKQSETDKYLLTYKMLAIGNGILERNDVVNLVHPYLAELSEECRETVHFIERAGTNIRYLDKVTPAANIFATGSHVGLELPLAGTAVGKAILAELPEEEVREIWEMSRIVQYTPNTICNLDELLAQLAKTRVTGFAYDNEEREVGLFCVGVSIPDYKGIYSYGISISAPLARMQEGLLGDVEEKLLRTKQKVTGVIGRQG